MSTANSEDTAEPFTEAQKTEILTNVSRRLGVTDPDDLFNTIGYGGITVQKISAKLRDEFDRVVKPEEEALPQTAEQVVTQKRKKSSGGVVIDGVEGLAVKFAKRLQSSSRRPGHRLHYKGIRDIDTQAGLPERHFRAEQSDICQPLAECKMGDCRFRVERVRGTDQDSRPAGYQAHCRYHDGSCRHEGLAARHNDKKPRRLYDRRACRDLP